MAVDSPKRFSGLPFGSLKAGERVPIVIVKVGDRLEVTVGDSTLVMPGDGTLTLAGDRITVQAAGPQKPQGKEGKADGAPL